MTDPRRATSLGTLIFLAAACGGGDGEQASGIPLDELPVRLAEIACSRVDWCLGPILAEAVSQDHCRDELERTFEDGLVARWQAAVEDGTVEYHPEHAQACLDAFETAGCRVDALPSECEATLSGQVPSPGDCEASIECAGAAYCRLEAECPGTCMALEPEGATCSSDDACEPGLFCRGTCERRWVEGESCANDEGPGCGDGLYCTSFIPGVPTCRSEADTFSADEGRACNPRVGPMCRLGLSCAVETVHPELGPVEWVCVPGLVARGGACRPGLPDPCAPGQFCDAVADDADGTCADLPGEGEPCRPDFFVPGCAEGLTCADDTCVVIRRIGEDCVSPDQCTSGRCDAGTCVTPPLCEAL